MSIDAKSIALLFIDCIVLDGRANTLALKTFDVVCRQPPGQQGVFGERLKVATAGRVAMRADRRTES